MIDRRATAVCVNVAEWERTGLQILYHRTQSTCSNQMKWQDLPLSTYDVFRPVRYVHQFWQIKSPLTFSYLLIVPLIFNKYSSCPNPYLTIPFLFFFAFHFSYIYIYIILFVNLQYNLWMLEIILMRSIQNDNKI